MKTILSLTFLTVIFLSCSTRQLAQAAHLQCSKFKNGTFEQYHDSMRIEIVRQDNIQIERLDLGEAKYKVVWTSECEYYLELLSTTIEFLKNEIGAKYYVTILATEGDECDMVPFSRTHS